MHCKQLSKPQCNYIDECTRLGFRDSQCPYNPNPSKELSRFKFDICSWYMDCVECPIYGHDFMKVPLAEDQKVGVYCDRCKNFDLIKPIKVCKRNALSYCPYKGANCYYCRDNPDKHLGRTIIVPRILRWPKVRIDGEGNSLEVHRIKNGVQYSKHLKEDNKCLV